MLASISKSMYVKQILPSLINFFLYPCFCVRAVNHLMATKTFWLCLLCILVLAMLPRFVIRVFSAYLRPNDIQIAREYEKFEKENDASAVDVSANPSANPQQEITL